jgi:hypothetical protein
MLQKYNKKTLDIPTDLRYTVVKLVEIEKEKKCLSLSVFLLFWS